MDAVSNPIPGCRVLRARSHLRPSAWRASGGPGIGKLADIATDLPGRAVPTNAMFFPEDFPKERQWEAARKINIKGETVTLDPGGPLAEAAWAKQRAGRATQALPNGYCGLPVVKTCPHASACLTCPMFVTTSEFLPQHRQQRGQVIQIISAAEARGQQRLAEMNRQVLGNLERIITALKGTDAV